MYDREEIEGLLNQLTKKVSWAENVLQDFKIRNQDITDSLDEKTEEIQDKILNLEVRDNTVFDSLHDKISEIEPLAREKIDELIQYGSNEIFDKKTEMDKALKELKVATSLKAAENLSQRYEKKANSLEWRIVINTIILLVLSLALSGLLFVSFLDKETTNLSSLIFMRFYIALPFGLGLVFYGNLIRNQIRLKDYNWHKSNALHTYAILEQEITNSKGNDKEMLQRASKLFDEILSKELISNQKKEPKSDKEKKEKHVDYSIIPEILKSLKTEHSNNETEIKRLTEYLIKALNTETT